ncbi:hypothetical protein MtrunA17_Chr2g0284961 [Medicago truncatula]|uniref:Uncharacterized protein n=1 Tax=Medicago truncatula TaxID=3880 RepID=A0A396JAL0_MEDTR|nr:hypothetical protein MtrunA17_Chr2g0284961 [Medicago truncatula]
MVFWFKMLLVVHQGWMDCAFVMKGHAIIGVNMCLGMQFIPLRLGAYSLQQECTIHLLIQGSLIQWILNTLLHKKLRWNWISLHSLVPLVKHVQVICMRSFLSYLHLIPYFHIK